MSTPTSILRITYDSYADLLLAELGDPQPSQTVFLPSGMMILVSRNAPDELIGFEIADFSEAFGRLVQHRLRAFLGPRVVEILEEVHRSIPTDLPPLEALEEEDVDPALRAGVIEKEERITQPTPRMRLALVDELLSQHRGEGSPWSLTDAVDELNELLAQISSVASRETVVTGRYVSIQVAPAEPVGGRQGIQLRMVPLDAGGEPLPHEGFLFAGLPVVTEAEGVVSLTRLDSRGSVTLHSLGGDVHAFRIPTRIGIGGSGFVAGKPIDPVLTAAASVHRRSLRQALESVEEAYRVDVFESSGGTLMVSAVTDRKENRDMCVRLMVRPFQSNSDYEEFVVPLVWDDALGVASGQIEVGPAGAGLDYLLGMALVSPMEVPASVVAGSIDRAVSETSEAFLKNVLDRLN